jgi:MFS family permease
VNARISQKAAVGTVFVAAMFMSILDATIVNVALPTIGRDFGVSATAVDGIAIAFLVSLAISIPASGWLGDKYGGKRVLLTAIALFTGASALCGLASGLSELVAFRILQGAAGGMLAPVGMAMLYRVFPPDERIRAAAILTVPTTLAPALGPVLGGLFVTELSWSCGRPRPSSICGCWETACSGRATGSWCWPRSRSSARCTRSRCTSRTAGA